MSSCGLLPFFYVSLLLLIYVSLLLLTSCVRWHNNTVHAQVRSTNPIRLIRQGMRYESLQGGMLWAGWAGCMHWV